MSDDALSHPHAPSAMVPAEFAEKAMGSLMKLHTELVDEKERRVELYRRLMEKEQALAELKMYVKLLEERLAPPVAAVAPAPPPVPPAVEVAPARTAAREPLHVVRPEAPAIRAVPRPPPPPANARPARVTRIAPAPAAAAASTPAPSTSVRAKPPAPPARPSAPAPAAAKPPRASDGWKAW